MMNTYQGAVPEAFHTFETHDTPEQVLADGWFDAYANYFRRLDRIRVICTPDEVAPNRAGAVVLELLVVARRNVTGLIKIGVVPLRQFSVPSTDLYWAEYTDEPVAQPRPKLARGRGSNHPD